MKTEKAKTRLLVSVLALVGLLGLCSLAAAGNLEPSAPAGPTMKTLSEVEPRGPIHASDLPLTITEPNSYYLVEDVNFTDTLNHVITIECNDVTIDLMGYTLKGPDSGSKSGIYMHGRSNVEIRNGTVRDFGSSGIYEDGSGKNHRVIAVRSVSNGDYGICLYGYDHLVKGCTASDNVDSATGTVYGISAGTGSTVTGNTAYRNGASAAGTVYGIYLSGNSLVDQNTAYGNGGTNMNACASCTFGTNHAP